ncbi:MAG: hypothetical protein JRN52_01445 [Nitrososphaerota archaeon]|nr:hypothetical protein [Nitrososphaerota archaeon]
MTVESQFSGSEWKSETVVAKGTTAYYERSERQINRRSRLETCCEILSAIAAGASKPTHVMYKANLSWGVMRVYMEILIQRELVDEVREENRIAYRLTNRGYELMNQYMQIREKLVPS